jgi:nucleotide-binding universal stress UspA family protein
MNGEVGMKAISRVLLAVDESRHADLVTEKAIGVAQAFAAEIFLVNVHPKVLALGQPYYQQILDKYVEQAEHIMGPHVLKLEKSGLDFKALVLEGDPAEMINETARIEQCDLIVMGSKGLSNIMGLTLGSVSSKVLHSAQTMVLMVP